MIIKIMQQRLNLMGLLIVSYNSYTKYRMPSIHGVESLIHYDDCQGLLPEHSFMKYISHTNWAIHELWHTN